MQGSIAVWALIDATIIRTMNAAIAERHRF
jgi:hypothetical protein